LDAKRQQRDCEVEECSFMPANDIKEARLNRNRASASDLMLTC
jgi:hypothetical protein